MPIGYVRIPHFAVAVARRDNPTLAQGPLLLVEEHAGLPVRGTQTGLERSQTIDRTRMSKRGNRDLKRALFQIASPLVWFDQSENPYKELYERKVREGRAWYEAMPFVCAALARHIYHCLKYNDPYDIEKAFQGSTPSPASDQELVDLEANLDEKFEVMETHLRQNSSEPSLT